jgi:hypothetical protein
MSFRLIAQALPRASGYPSKACRRPANGLCEQFRPQWESLPRATEAEHGQLIGTHRAWLRTRRHGKPDQELVVRDPPRQGAAFTEHPVTGEWLAQIAAAGQWRSVTNSGANALDVEQLHAPVAGARVRLSPQGLTKEPPK